MNRLTEGEREEVAKRMEKDEAFRKRVDEVRAVKQLVLAHERKNIWAKLQKEEQSFQSQPGGRQAFFIPRIAYYAAAALVVVAIGVTWFMNQQDDSKLFTAYYKPYEELKFQRSRGGGNLEAAVLQAVELYHEQKYQEVISSLEKLDPKDDRVYFVMGLAYLGEKNFENALENFNQVSEDFDQADVFHWYKALTLIALGKNDDAKVSLDKIDSRIFPVNTLKNRIFEEN